MNQKNAGLTVGELTIAIASILVIFLIWSGINNKDKGEEISSRLIQHHLTV